jgi:hypothetical protein
MEKTEAVNRRTGQCNGQKKKDENLQGPTKHYTQT